MVFTETTVNSEIMFSGRVVKVRRDSVRLHTGAEVVREVVVHPGGVVVLPIDEEGNAYLVRQFRYPMGREIAEACAGRLEPNEDPRFAAIRELSEETGFTADEIIDLGKTMVSPGYDEELNYHYLALGLHSGDSHPDPDEYVRVEKYPFTQLLEMAYRGELNDAKTIVTLFRAERALADRAAARAKA